MSHILGIPHSVGGVFDAITGLFSPSPQLPIVSNDVFSGGAGMPPVVIDQHGGSCGDQGPKLVFDPSADCGAGKWKRKTRRRRKRLATTSDIKDLAALKAVLGGGKAFDTWIASRGR